MLAEEIIAREKKVMTPGYKIIPPERFSFVEIEIEERKDRSDLQPDIVGITEDGQRWHIEIKNTSEIKEDKKTKIKESNIPCLEIDVSDQIPNENTLNDFLLNSKENREWINNPIYDKLIVKRENERNIAELEQRKNEEAEYKRILSSYDKSIFDIFQDENYCINECKHLEYGGLCEYRIKRYKRSSIIIVCDKVRRKDAEETKIIREHHDESLSISDNSNIVFQPYFDFSVKGLTLYEIRNKMKIEKSFKIEGNDVNAVDKIDVRGCNDGIVFLYKCNDRVYPFKVIATWLENERLKYKIIGERKDYKRALECYNDALMSTIDVESLDQDNIRDKNNQAAF